MSWIWIDERVEVGAAPRAPPAPDPWPAPQIFHQQPAHHRHGRFAPPPPPALHPLEAGLLPKPEKRAAARERGLQLEDAVDDDATEGEPQISKTADRKSVV